jgi:hypothetical protein
VTLATGLGGCDDDDDDLAGTATDGSSTSGGSGASTGSATSSGSAGSSGGNSGASTGGGDALSPYIDGTVSVTGAVSSMGTFQTSRYEYSAMTSCADIVAMGSGGGGYGPEGSWQVPKPYFGEYADGRPFSLYVEIDDRDFAGAGSCPLDLLRFGEIDFDGDFEGLRFEQDDLISTSVVTIDAGMNGSWTFTNLVADDGSGATVSGSVTWTCRD